METLESPQETAVVPRGRKPVRRICADLRVRYAETDQMGKAHHSHYLEWFELGRMELLRANGVSYADLERAGIMFPVTKAEIEYRQSVGYDEDVQIWVALGAVRSRTLTFLYEARRTVDGGLLARGRTVVACTDRRARARSIPDAVIRALPPAGC